MYTPDKNTNLSPRQSDDKEENKTHIPQDPNISRNTVNL